MGKVKNRGVTIPRGVAMLWCLYVGVCRMPRGVSWGCGCVYGCLWVLVLGVGVAVGVGVAFALWCGCAVGVWVWCGYCAK